MTTEENRKADEILQRLQASEFRRKFRLGEKEKAYVKEKGMAVIRSHAEDFIEKRLAPAYPKNDGNKRPCGAIQFSSPSTQPQPAAGDVYSNGTASRRGKHFPERRKNGLPI